ncbi:MAG: bifunctional phosphoglucose/phosphomannose isomerase [Candidatus Hodarchaeota archaeon]
MILDDSVAITKVDPQNMLPTVEKWSNFLLDAKKRALKVDFSAITQSDFRNIVVLGMGGSAIGGDYARTLLRDTLRIPIASNRRLNLPSYVSKDSLIIASSYSGNTYETLFSFIEATKRGCSIVAITSGGLLEEACKKLNIPYVHLPQGIQPRAAFPFMLVPIVVILSQLNLIESTFVDEIEDISQIISQLTEKFGQKIPFNENPIKQDANQLLDCLPIVHSYYDCLSMRIRGQLNENAKILSMSYEIPELVHNHIMGFSTPQLKNIKLLNFHTGEEPEVIVQTDKLLQELAQKNNWPVLNFKAEGNSLFAKLFSLTYTGDLLSVYLAILRKQDPSHVDLIDHVKKTIGTTVDPHKRIKDFLSQL